MAGMTGSSRLMSMKIRPLVAVGMAAGAIGLSGCAVALLGAGAAGGYAIGKDSVTSHFDLSQERVYRQALAAANQMGLVKVEDEAHGLIKATINDATVTITVKPLTKKTVELKVKARGRFLLPKVSIAQDVYQQINEGL